MSTTVGKNPLEKNGVALIVNNKKKKTLEMKCLSAISKMTE